MFYVVLVFYVMVHFLCYCILFLCYCILLYYCAVHCYLLLYSYSCYVCVLDCIYCTSTLPSYVNPIAVNKYLPLYLYPIRLRWLCKYYVTSVTMKCPERTWACSDALSIIQYQITDIHEDISRVLSLSSSTNFPLPTHDVVNQNSRQSTLSIWRLSCKYFL